jgi:hypothetical protein
MDATAERDRPALWVYLGRQAYPLSLTPSDWSNSILPYMATVGSATQT